ncbi:hypothetical protein J6590_039245 [Homalodisca vitripennis]|nr:hypothetical protein J6590_039245 [Homalodisca vitripennis]
MYYVENVPNWSQACENMAIPSEIIVLETVIHQHQNLYESMCQAYTEVYNSYQSLLNGLDLLVQVCLNYPQPPSRPPYIRYGNNKLASINVHSTSKKLLYQLDHLVQVCNQPPLEHPTRKHGDGGQSDSSGGSRQTGNPAADYSEGASHVLAVIHQILNHHRSLEHRWHSKKIKLHQRLALRLFQEDVKQVSDRLMITC